MSRICVHSSRPLRSEGSHARDPSDTHARAMPSSVDEGPISTQHAGAETVERLHAVGEAHGLADVLAPVGGGA